MSTARIYCDELLTKTVVFELPTWHRRERVLFSIKDVPFEMQPRLHPGFTCLVDIDESATEADNLNIRNWRYTDVT